MIPWQRTGIGIVLVHAKQVLEALEFFIQVTKLIDENLPVHMERGDEHVFFFSDCFENISKIVQTFFLA